MDPCKLTMGVTALANMLAQEFKDEDLDLLGSVFNQLGDTLQTISASREACRAAGERKAGRQNK